MCRRAQGGSRSDGFHRARVRDACPAVVPVFEYGPRGWMFHVPPLCRTGRVPGWLSPIGTLVLALRRDVVGGAGRVPLSGAALRTRELVLRSQSKWQASHFCYDHGDSHWRLQTRRTTSFELRGGERDVTSADKARQGQSAAQGRANALLFFYRLQCADKRRNWARARTPRPFRDP